MVDLPARLSFSPDVPIEDAHTEGEVVVRTSRFHRGLVPAALLSMILLLVGSSATAAPLVQQRTAQRRQLQHRVAQIRRVSSGTTHRLTREVAKLDRALAVVSPRSMNNGRWQRVIHDLAQQRHRLLGNVQRRGHQTSARIAALQRQIGSISSWLRQWGVFKTCPVSGPNTVNNDFGVLVQMPGVPVHIHEGNDITANTGTPIVAPFDGTAVVSPNVLGGLAVKVYGSAGYVYNAHLESYGHLGTVRAGEVIGYVGSTGDASGPHDHFEWHPGNGSAVDPNPLLSVVC
jgi:murein DD-endopeptidase MepM/ murein hydrolase activator NlpD